MDSSKIPSDLVAFLQAGKPPRYETSRCEIGKFSLYSLHEIAVIELHLITNPGTFDEDWLDQDPHHGGGYYHVTAVDLIKECEHYEPVGLLVYVPELDAFGSYDDSHMMLVIFPGVSWSEIVAAPVPYINAAVQHDFSIATPVNPVGIFPHAGPSGFPRKPTITAVGDEHFTLTCHACGNSNRIRSVSVDHAQRTYSILHECSCGHNDWFTNVDTKLLPAKLTFAADARHLANRIKDEIDEQRRTMKGSSIKKLLRNSRVDLPIEESDGKWLVYELADFGKVTYVSESREYCLSAPNDKEEFFADIESLMRFLDG